MTARIRYPETSTYVLDIPRYRLECLEFDPGGFKMADVGGVKIVVGKVGAMIETS